MTEHDSASLDPRQYQARPDLLADRVILITGASGAIGGAVARAAAAHGARVLLLGRTVNKLERVYDDIVAAAGARPSICPFDFSRADWSQYLSLAELIANEHGRLDGLLHSAGILGDRSPIEHYDVAVWQKVLMINLTATFCLTRACLPLLKQSPDASVLFTSSGVGRRGRAYWGAYSVSKFGCEALAQILADETETNTAIRANSINPGRTLSPMRREAYPLEDAETLPAPETLVAPYLYLLGPDSRGVSGGQFDCQ